MTARDNLVVTLTNLFARTRNGRMDAHKAEAERLVDAVLHEAVQMAYGYNAAMHDAADLINPKRG